MHTGMTMNGHPFPAGASRIPRLILLLVQLLHGCSEQEPPSQPAPITETKASPCPDPLSYPDSDSDAATRSIAFEFLRCTPIFSDALGGMTYPTRHAISFRALVGEPDAPAIFTRLIREGATAGQLYGLAGLRYTDTLLFARELPNFIERIDSVYRLIGCFRSLEPVHHVVQAEGGIRLLPGESLAAWERKRSGRARRSGSYPEPDIYGGAIPMELMGRDREE